MLDTTRSILDINTRAELSNKTTLGSKTIEDKYINLVHKVQAYAAKCLREEDGDKLVAAAHLHDILDKSDPGQCNQLNAMKFAKVMNKYSPSYASLSRGAAGGGKSVRIK